MQYFDTLRSDVYDVTAYINPTMMQFNIQQTQKKMKENFFKQKRMFMAKTINLEKQQYHKQIDYIVWNLKKQTEKFENFIRGKIYISRYLTCEYR